MFTNLLVSVSATIRHFRLVLLIWVGYAALAAVAAAPALAWWRSAFDHSVEAGALLRGFNVGVLADLNKYDQAGLFNLLITTAASSILLATVASAFVMGGILTIVAGTEPPRGVTREFFCGAGRFFWRFLRLLLTGGACVVIVGAGVLLALAAIESPLADGISESTVYLLMLFNLIAVSLACGLFLLALDYARVQVVIDDSRGMLSAYFRAVRFVLRHAFVTYGMASVVLIAMGGLAAGYIAYESASPVASTWGSIALVAAVQQAVTITRVGLRVSLVDAEFRFARRATLTVDSGALAVVGPPSVPDPIGEIPGPPGPPATR